MLLTGSSPGHLRSAGLEHSPMCNQRLVLEAPDTGADASKTIRGDGLRWVVHSGSSGGSIAECTAEFALHVHFLSASYKDSCFSTCPGHVPQICKKLVRDRISATALRALQILAIFPRQTAFVTEFGNNSATASVTEFV